MCELSEKVKNDLATYNAMIDEWANGLLNLKIREDEISTQIINQKKKSFYYLHWARGTRGIKHYANQMLCHLEKEENGGREIDNDEIAERNSM